MIKTNQTYPVYLTLSGQLSLLYSFVNVTKCRSWELSAPWTKDQIKVPVKFIVGDLDLTYNAPGTKDYIHKGGLKKVVPLLQEVIVLKDVAHFIHEEKPDEINKHIHGFFRKFSKGFSCSAL